MRLATRCLAVLSVTPAVVVLPVVPRPAARPHPVAPKVAEYAVPRAAAFAGPALARPQAADARTTSATFQTLGVTWAAGTGTDSVAYARVRQHGTWTAWHALDSDGDEPDATPGPDTTSALRNGTAPWFTGPADGYQVKVATHSGTPPRDVRVSLVDPGRSAADAQTSPTLGSSTAQATMGQPTIWPRAAWGADESMRRGTPDYADTIHMGFVHHTDTSNSYSAAQAPAMIRGVYAYHVLSRGWSDIGYNFLVDRYGRIWEGRYGGASRPVIGAHTGGFNTGTFGVALLGTYTSVVPTAGELAALEKLFAWKLGLYYVNPYGRSTLVSHGGTKYPAGAVVTFNNISGHRDAGLTSCPGTQTYNRLPWVRAATKKYMTASLYLPTVSATSVLWKSVPVVTVRAGVALTQGWRLTVRNARSGAVLKTMSGTATTSLSASWDMAGATPDTYDVLLESWSLRTVARPWHAIVKITSPLPNGVALSRGDGVPYAIVEAGRLVGVTPAMGTAVRQQPIVGYYGSTSVLAAPAAPPRDGMYVRSSTGATYLVVDGALRPVSSSVASALGLPAPRALPSAVLALLPTGASWTSTLAHPDGTVVTAPDGAWRLEDGVRRPFTSATARTAWSKGLAVAAATTGDLARPVGTPLAPPEGIVLRTASGAGVVSDGFFRTLPDPAALGYDVAKAPVATADDLAALPVGQPVQAGRHQSGALLRNGTAYVEVVGTTKRNVDPALVAADPRPVAAAIPGELGSFGGARWTPPSGLAGIDANNTVHVVASGRLVALDHATAQALGYLSVSLPHLDPADFGPLPYGTLNDATAHPAGSVVTDGTAYWLIDAGTRRPLAASLVATWLGRPALPATATDLALPTGLAAPPATGAWVRTPDGVTYLVDGGVRRVVSATVANRLGLSAVPTIAVDAADLTSATRAGAPIP